MLRAIARHRRGFSDHFVSEAIYLSDPDRHGIEIYADRPRELWEGQAGQRMTTAPPTPTTSSPSWTIPLSPSSIAWRTGP